MRLDAEGDAFLVALGTGSIRKRWLGHRREILSSDKRRPARFLGLRVWASGERKGNARDANATGHPSTRRSTALSALRPTKTNEPRTIPIGPRLKAELEMRRHGPDGKELPESAHIFGNELGEEIASVKTAWRATCRRAGIHDLHFHDLRREFGSRLLESGASEHDVRDFLGHANITTTSRYLKSTPLRLEKALANMERGSIRTSFA
jgi:integrase